MGQVLQFPHGPAFRPIRLCDTVRHTVWVRVVDREDPEQARWFLQFGIQRAASFGSLDGFTDEAARGREWHMFKIRGLRLTRRFLRDIEPLVLTRRIEVEIDNVRVRPAVAHAA